MALFAAARRWFFFLKAVTAFLQSCCLSALLGARPVNQFLPGGLSALTGGSKECARERQPLQEGH